MHAPLIDPRFILLSCRAATSCLDDILNSKSIRLFAVPLLKYDSLNVVRA